ncbi:MAG TPA: metallophosphoesterase family protein [Actinocrinis sp.]|nr:metallophosphoesterase family protein [Actinocrinis sp.]
MVEAISRRSLLRGATAGGLILAGPALLAQPAIAGTSGPEQLHLQFGADPSAEMTASWATAASVSRPRLRLGTPREGFGRTIEAQARTYTDGLNGVETITHHAQISGLWPDTDYVYEVTHDGAAPVQGAFRTAPRGRAAFRFTSFGDLGSGNPVWSKSSINAITAVAQVEQFAPVVHLLNGDLSYANVNPTSQPQVWADYLNNTQPSSAHRPWMPALGNHEIEAGNGAQGYNAYHTRFDLPDNGTSFSGNWYKFQVGSVLFISLDNNDVVYQNDGALDPRTNEAVYIHGYSGGVQTAWLKRTLAEARLNSSVDWIIAYMHQPAMSSSSSGSGSDLGIRQQFMSLFYEYGVDLVLAGHDHDYERTYAVRGTDSGTFLRPTVVSSDTKVVDTSKGLVHLVLGGGGTSSHDDVYGPPDTTSGGDPVSQIYTETEAYKVAANETEVATWSAVRDPNTTFPWGIAVFDVDPGRHPGDQTSITMTYYHTPAATAANPFPAPVAYDTFKAVRPRRDGWWGFDHH